MCIRALILFMFIQPILAVNTISTENIQATTSRSLRAWEQCHDVTLFSFHSQDYQKKLAYLKNYLLFCIYITYNPIVVLLSTKNVKYIVFMS